MVPYAVQSETLAGVGRVLQQARVVPLHALGNFNFFFLSRSRRVPLHETRSSSLPSLFLPFGTIQIYVPRSALREYPFKIKPFKPCSKSDFFVLYILWLLSL